MQGSAGCIFMLVGADVLFLYKGFIEVELMASDFFLFSLKMTAEMMLQIDANKLVHT